MKPKKRGRKSASQVSRIQPKIETEDDDVFEGGGRQLRRQTKLKSMKKEPPSLRTKTTCQITRSRATRASNRKIDNTNKHVDKNCNMSSQNSLETNSETVYSIESEVICLRFFFVVHSVNGFFLSGKNVSYRYILLY